jgi:hypothetical protein
MTGSGKTGIPTSDPSGSRERLGGSSSVGEFPGTIRKERRLMDTRYGHKADTFRSPGLALPQQAPPVDRRAAAPTAACANVPGLEASDALSTLSDIGRVAAPLLLALL